jgi:hypothetical protein
MSDFQYGDAVVFTDEFGQERLGTVISTDAYEMGGVLGVTGTYGCYVRWPNEVRPAQDYEVHQAAIESLNNR